MSSSETEKKRLIKTSKERSGPVDREHTSNVMKTLHAMRADGIGCDVRVECKDGEFDAHSIVLQAAGLEDRVKNIKNGILDFRDLPSSGVSVLLDYLYLGRARLSLENGLSALEVSRRLNMRDLFDKCRKFICPFMLDPAKLSMNGINVPSQDPLRFGSDQITTDYEKTSRESRESRSSSISIQGDSTSLPSSVKRQVEDLESTNQNQPKNHTSLNQPANMLINKRVLPSRLVKSSSKESASKETDNESTLTDRTEILRSEISRTEAALSSSKRITGSLSTGSVEPEVLSKRIESHLKSVSQSDSKDKSSEKSPRSSGTETITPSSSDNETEDSDDETASQMTDDRSEVAEESRDSPGSTKSRDDRSRDSDESTATTSSLGSLASKPRPRRQKSVKWV